MSERVDSTRSARPFNSNGKWTTNTAVPLFPTKSRDSSFWTPIESKACHAAEQFTKNNSHRSYHNPIVARTFRNKNKELRLLLLLLKNPVNVKCAIFGTLPTVSYGDPVGVSVTSIVIESRYWWRCVTSSFVLHHSINIRSIFLDSVVSCTSKYRTYVPYVTFLMIHSCMIADYQIQPEPDKIINKG